MDTTINNKRYAEILKRTVISLLIERCYRDVIYQQDGALVDFSVIDRNLFNNKLPNRWIGRGATHGGFLEWPTRSPDLSVNDFWLWGDIRQKLYQRPVPNTLNELTTKLRELLKINNETIRKVYQSFVRCYFCVATEGGHTSMFCKFMTL